MLNLGIVFRTAPAVIPAVLIFLLIAGISLPFYDYFRLRSRARSENKPLPGINILKREFTESQFLAYALCGTGFLLSISSLVHVISVKNSIKDVFIGVILFILGAALIILSQRMLRKFMIRARSWRKYRRIK